MTDTNRSLDGGVEYVTFEIDGRWFGAQVSDVHDVFAIQAVTPVPLARPDVAGLLNLRGRIVTAIDARRRLGMPARTGGYAGAMAIGVEREGESYGLVVDAVGEVLRLDADIREDAPGNLDESWREVACGVFRLPKGLLVALDIAKMLDAPPSTIAAAA
ncbi:MAG: chemotaxis protein CheW [Alphaproteobacteria bacterium]|nr:chemotaxis protein CheW [Alphaproteobacteria bacterium]